jgi:hypothetical protein
MVEQIHRADLSPRDPTDLKQQTFVLHWSPIVAGAVVAAGLSFVLLSFGSAIGLAAASASSSWRDTSSALALLGGLWLLLTSLASFGLGGYLAGHLRAPWNDATPHEVELRDGIHGLVVWGIAIIIGAFLTFAATRTAAPRPDLTTPTAASAEPLLAFELDRLFRSDDKPADPNSDPQIRAQAARIISSGLGHSAIAAEDRAYLMQLVKTRTGLPAPEAESRVDRTIAQANEAVSRARHAAVILAFMVGASLMMGAAAAWLGGASGGQHRDGSIVHHFWRRWDVDRMFFIR